MLIENIYNQIAEIEREIAVLPEGSITKKKIKDKDYYYHRITHDGKPNRVFIYRSSTSTTLKPLSIRS